VADIDGKVDIIDHDLHEGSLVIDHFPDLFGQVEHDADRDKQQQHHPEGDEVFF